MSIRATSFIWDHSQQTGAALLMLLAIADHANDDGLCWPSIARLAEKARVSERQAQRIVQGLAAAGELQILDRGTGRGRTSLYILKRYADSLKGDTAMSPFETRERVTSSAGKGDISGKKGDIQRGKGDIAMSPDPSLTTTVIEPSITVKTTTDTRAHKPPSSSSKPGGDSGRAANAAKDTRPEPGAAQHRAPDATVTAEPPTPLSGAPPSPSQAPPAELGAVTAALLENNWCDDAGAARGQAVALLGEGHPAEDVIHCAVRLDKSRARGDRIAFLRGVLRKRATEGRRPLKGNGRGEALTEEERRRKYAAPHDQLHPAAEPVIALDELDVVDSVTVRIGSDGKPNMDWEVEDWEVYKRKVNTPATFGKEQPAAVATVAATLERARVAMAETHAAQLLATFGHLPPAQLVATIEAAAAAAPPGKAPSLMGIRNQLRQLNATEAR